MEIISIAVIFVTLVLLSSAIANRIPKTGRYPDAKGETTEAVIVNTNKKAERSATMRLLGDDGRKYKVKLKPSEAKMWIKGDKVKIIVDSDKKRYRVLFNDYFRENESRLLEEAHAFLKKTVSTRFISAKIIGYTEKTSNELKSSEADSKTIFTFATLMRLVDVYGVMAIVLVLGFLWWFMNYHPSFKTFLLPLCLVLVLLWAVYSASEACKTIIRKNVRKS